MKARITIVGFFVLLTVHALYMRQQRNEARVLCDKWETAAITTQDSAKRMESLILNRGSPSERLDAWKPILQADGYSNVAMIVTAERAGQKIGAVVESNKLVTVGNLYFTSTPPNP